MNTRKLILIGIFCLFTAPAVLAGEIGTGSPNTAGEIGTGTPTRDTAGEIGTGTPGINTAGEIGTGTPGSITAGEIGTGSDIDAFLAWWNLLLRSF